MLDIDKQDIKLLELLQTDSSQSSAEIAEKLNMSQSPCWRRINRLEQSGVINRRVAVIDREKLWKMVYDLKLEPLPGHTPGHRGINAASNGDRALFTGDCLHHPSQIIFPEWNSGFCVDPAQSAATRRAVLERLADTDELMIPAHFVDPGYGHIVSDGDRFSFKAVG